MSRTDSYNAQSIENRMCYYDSRARVLMFDLGPSVKFDPRCQSFKSSPKTRETRLGSGIQFSDELVGMQEIGGNAGRIDGWRRSISYEDSAMVRGTI